MCFVLLIIVSLTTIIKGLTPISKEDFCSTKNLQSITSIYYLKGLLVYRIVTSTGLVYQVGPVGTFYEIVESRSLCEDNPMKPFSGFTQPNLVIEFHKHPTSDVIFVCHNRKLVQADHQFLYPVLADIEGTKNFRVIQLPSLIEMIVVYRNEQNNGNMARLWMVKAKKHKLGTNYELIGGVQWKSRNFIVMKQANNLFCYQEYIVENNELKLKSVHCMNELIGLGCEDRKTRRNSTFPFEKPEQLKLKVIFSILAILCIVFLVGIIFQVTHRIAKSQKKRKPNNRMRMPLLVNRTPQTSPVTKEKTIVKSSIAQVESDGIQSTISRVKGLISPPPMTTRTRVSSPVTSISKNLSRDNIQKLRSLKSLASIVTYKSYPKSYTEAMFHRLLHSSSISSPVRTVRSPSVEVFTGL